MRGQEDIRIGTLVKADGAPGYIKRILPLGFESFSLHMGDECTDTDLQSFAGEIKSAIEGEDAVISSVGVYGNPLEYDGAAEKTRRSWDMLIENAGLFGAGIITGFAGRLRGRPVPESIERFREIFGPAAEKAGERGIRLAFENCPMGGTWKTGDRNIAFNPAAWNLMFEAVDRENIGLQWEPCHQMVQLAEPLPQLRKWAGRIFHVHGKCATVRRDVISENGILGPEIFAYHRMPGFGDLDWKNVISELRLAGFKGSIDIEGWHDPVFRGELEMTGQAAALKYLKNCRGGDYVPNPR